MSQIIQMKCIWRVSV